MMKTAMKATRDGIGVGTKHWVGCVVAVSVAVAAMAMLFAAVPGLQASPASPGPQAPQPKLVRPDPAPGLAKEDFASQARRVSLNPQPGWSVSGAWSQDGDTLLLVDARRSVVLEYTTRGDVRAQHAVPLEGSMIYARPSWIRPWPRGGYIVEQEDAGFVVLDRQLRSTLEVDLRATKGLSGFKDAAVFHWVPLSTGDLVAFGDVELQSGLWKTGIFQVALTQPPRVEMLMEVDIEPEELDLYLVGLPYLTAIDDRVYFVDMTERPPVLREIGKRPDGSIEVRRLPISTTQTSRRPLLSPHLSGHLDQLSFVYSELERSSMISGIYGWDGELYLLFHEPNGVGDGSSWSLTRFDPDTEELGREVRLPTTAAHLTLIPGSESWAVLEKGRVKGFGQQEIPSLLLIPSSEISP